jgi:hypothetical protein
MPCLVVVIDLLKDCSALIFWVKQWKSSLLLNCLTLQMKALRSFEIAVTILWATQHNVPEDLNLQQRVWCYRILHILHLLEVILF